MGYLFSSCSSVGFHGTPLQTLDPIAIALGYTPETDGETLLLRAPHTRVIELERKQAGTDFEASSQQAGSLCCWKVLRTILGKKTNCQSYLLVSSANYSNNWFDKMCPQGQ